MLQHLFKPDFYKFLFQKIRNGYEQYIWVSRFRQSFPDSQIDSDIKLVGTHNITLGHHCKIDKHTYLNAGNKLSYAKEGKISCGNETIIAHGAIIYAGGGEIHIGDRVRVGIGTIISATSEDSFANPDVAKDQHQHIFETVNIGNFCMIAGGAIILGGTELGENCIVGSGAVVKGKYPANSTLIGNPARAIPRLGFIK